MARSLLETINVSSYPSAKDGTFVNLEIKRQVSEVIKRHRKSLAACYSYFQNSKQNAKVLLRIIKNFVQWNYKKQNFIKRNLEN